MKWHQILLGLAGALWLAAPIHATTFYVDVNSTNPTPPYADWSTAATDIQSAVDASSDGDQIWVNDGIYQTGGRVVYGALTNRVVINKAITVQSVNGSTATTIVGFPIVGDGAVRCVYLTNNAVMNGFTLTYGGTRNSGDTNSEESGGGVWCESTNALLINCLLLSNTASIYGGGLYCGCGSNCILMDNSANSGGAASGGILINSLIVSNQSNIAGGGIFSNIANNCTFIFNAAVYYGDAAYGSSLNGSLLCSNAFFNYSSDGTHPYPYYYALEGGGAAYSTLVNCTIVGNNSRDTGGGAYYCALTNCTVATNSASSAGGGAYAGILSGCILYSNVAQYGGAAEASGVDQVVIANCIISNNSAQYGGGVAAYIGRYLTNCIITDSIIAGNFASNTGGGAYKCLLTGCSLSYNTVSNSAGSWPGGGGGAFSCTLTDCLINNNQLTYGTADAHGGGVYMSTLSNCQLISNSVSVAGIISVSPYGGGADSSTLNHCIVVGNNSGNYKIPYGGGDGGGAENSTLNNCTLSGNYAVSSGGGADSSTLTNCLLAGNYAKEGGGGMRSGLAVNCTFVSNSATLYGDQLILGGGGAQGSTLNNCILYYNSNPGGSNNWLGGTLTNCCSMPVPAYSAGNITNEPLFVNLAGGNFRLQANSPCINSGKNAFVNNGFDLDGRPRIVGGTVDIGAYEFQGAGMGEFIGWLQQYGLPTDGTADYADADGDGMSNYAEWKAGTNPTNAASVLALQVPATTNTTGITVTWQSVSGVTYYLLSSTHLPAFTSIQSNLVGQAGSTSYTDATATNGGPYFYRVGVQ